MKRKLYLKPKISQYPLLLTILISIFIFLFNSCATQPPTLGPTPTIPSTKLLTIKVYFKNLIEPQYTIGNDTYHFYCALCFRFDQNFSNFNNIDLWQEVYFFENGFKRFHRVQPPSTNTSTPQEWSSVILDTNSEIQNNVLSFKIFIPDNIIGSQNIYNFIVLVFLRNFEYNQMQDDFGQSPVDYYGFGGIQNIVVNIPNTNLDQVYTFQDQEGDINDSNLPSGFPQNKKDSLDIIQIEYILRQI